MRLLYVVGIKILETKHTEADQHKASSNVLSKKQIEAIYITPSDLYSDPTLWVCPDSESEDGA